MTKRQLECSCCGRDAGRWEQWHNRDTGYGVCAPCVHWLRMRGTDDAELERNYGKAGVNYENAPPPKPES
jgi:hypothetical protein